MKTICVEIRFVWKSNDGKEHNDLIAHKVDTDCHIDAIKKVVDWIMSDTDNMITEHARNAESVSISVNEVK